MSQSDPPVWAQKLALGCGGMIALFILGVGAVGLVEHLTGSDSGGESQSISADGKERVGDAEEGDAGANLACTHFRNVSSDYSAGILTLRELREKLIEVYDDAKLSSEPGIASSGRKMLADLTHGDLDAFARSIGSFDRACLAAGF
ncbi:MAG: hypothetical protein WD556_07775 [Actinomycetota bacterium]